MTKYPLKIIIILPLLLLLVPACDPDGDPPPDGFDYRQEMRDFVIGLSQYARSIYPACIVIPQNGIELVTDNGEPDGTPSSAYLSTINGNGQEDLYYGYNKDDQASPANERDYLKSLMDVSLGAGNTMLVTDYCSTPSKMDQSYSQNQSAAYISFAADHRELDNVPAYPDPVFNENNNSPASLNEAKNFLYLINPELFASKAAFIQAVSATNYDLLIMDLFFNDGTAFSSQEIAQLRSKASGGNRLLICYLSIGEAEDYRYYWDSAWNSNKPGWMDAENPDWAGNFKVKYWESAWQDIIFGNDNSYLKMILDAGFDGVYLDIIDAFEYFEIR